MIPIRDHHPSQRPAVVTHALVALNLGLFLAYWPAGTDAGVMQLFNDWGLVPARILSLQGVMTLFTAQFLHGGWLHLGLNLLFLWIFGDNLEDELGRLRFLGFYLACGVLAGLVQVLAGPGSTVPVIGASGAVAGVLGGYALMFPRARVDLLLWLVIALRIVTLPAWLLLGLWFLLQIAGGLASPAGQGGTAFWAHVGGFLAGVALIWPLWRARGGRHFWRRFQGRPPHPEARYSIPVVRGRGTDLPPPRRSGLFRKP